MPSKKNITPLIADKYYHVFNRGIGKEKIFKEQEDYQFFMALYSHFVSDFVNTYAYCMINNHFHFLIKIKYNVVHDYGKKVSEEFRKMFSIYAVKYNHKYGRAGSLFTKPFKRIEITEQSYLKHLVYYIHYNPQKHHVTNDFRSYEFSSFMSFYSSKESRLNRDEVIQWFDGDMEEFSEFHDFKAYEKFYKKLFIEKDD